MFYYALIKFRVGGPHMPFLVFALALTFSTFTCVYGMYRSAVPRQLDWTWAQVSIRKHRPVGNLIPSCHQMIVTIKLTSLAFACHDGWKAKPNESLPPFALRDVPGMLPLLGHGTATKVSTTMTSVPATRGFAGQ